MGLDETLLKNQLVKKLANRLDALGAIASEEHLVRFDWKVMTVLAICFVLFALNIGLKTSGSSIREWNTFVKGDTTKQMGIGSPKFIRFDEWGMHTPMLLSQVAHNFPISNPAVGAMQSPLLMSLPVRSFPSILRPQLWSYFLFDTETAYSIAWNYKTYGMFVALFLIFLLLTKNRFLPSLVGSLWVTFSAFIQWWYSTPEPEMIMAACLMFVFFIYILYSQKLGTIVVSVFGLGLYSVTFLLFFYPPHQIPLAFCITALVIGYVWSAGQLNLVKKLVLLRGVGIVLILSLLGVSLASFMHLAQDTISLMSNTVYPGARISSGGDVSVVQYWSGFLDSFITEHHVPASWKNVCEASNFVLLWPLVLVRLFQSYKRKDKMPRIQLMLIAYILFISIWMLAGYPAIVAKWTLLDRVKENRAFIGLGLGSIILTILSLCERSNANEEMPITVNKATTRNKKKDKSGRNVAPLLVDRLRLSKVSMAASILFCIGIFIYGYAANEATNSFFSYQQLMFSALYFGIVGYFLLEQRITYFAVAMISYVVFNNYLVNPITVGLGAIQDKELGKTIASLKASNPRAKWLYYGSNIAANYFIASGVDVISGSKFAPDLEFLHSIDPLDASKSIYNRFAQVRYMPNDSARKPSDVRFQLDNIDGYSVFINPDNPVLMKSGVDFIVSAVVIPNASMKVLEPLFEYPVNNMWFYRYRRASDTLTRSVLTGLQDLGISSRFRIGDLKISQNEARDAFVITGIAFDAASNDIAGGICANVDGRIIRGDYGLENPHVSDPKFKPSAFKLVLPMAYTGSGHVQFRLQVLSKDMKSFGTIDPAITLDIK